MNPIAFLLHGLTLLFVGLKLTDHIDWSWWLVTLPSWGPIAVTLFLALLCWLGMAIAWLLMSKEERIRQKAADAISDFADALEKRK